MKIGARANSNTLLIAGGLIVFFLAATVKAGVVIAALVTLCFVTGYLNDSYVNRPAIAFLLRREVDASQLPLGVAALLGNGLLIYMRLGFLLLMVTLGVLLMDALVVRFR